MIYPENTEAVADSTPLEISKAKRTEMVAKAKELLTEPMSDDTLKAKLEEYYIFGQLLTPEQRTSKESVVKDGHTSKHYTSAQLKDIVNQVKTDLTPDVEEITE